MPAKPASIDEALRLYENKADEVLNLIYVGMEAQATDKAQDDMTGWHTTDEDTGDITEEAYEGSYADAAKYKLINAAVLNIAKIQGYNQEMTAAEKQAIKASVREMLRNTPALLKSIQ
jgi:hypothetical protein